MAYPLEYLEVSNLCSRLERIRRGQPKYPAEYYDLRNEYHATKDKMVFVILMYIHMVLKMVLIQKELKLLADRILDMLLKIH